ncbi:Voltage-gated ClC-type chloride channel ClcB [Austwickia sp. TVS 96-490-7B]|nr:Voltage-gated ClC-type chloride channel ClcB [Austwickia sp. TVS 96-490-7B]
MSLRHRLRTLIAPRRPGRWRDSVSRWLWWGTIIGVVSGGGAVLFFCCLEHGTHLLLHTVAGHHPPGTVGEGGGFPGTGFERPWAIPLVAGGGALLAGLIVAWLAPEAEGHGTDAAIDAVHHEPTSLRGRVAAVKIIASTLVIGSGGSGGREGPTAQISATVISQLCRWLRVPTPDARLAVAAAMASGIGAIFRAPLGGALLGAELLYRDDLEADAIMPSLISSIVAYCVFGSVYGFQPIFGNLGTTEFTAPTELPGFAVLGAAAGAMGWLYAALFYRTTGMFSRSRIPAAIRPAIGGLVVGVLGLLVPAALGTGYGWIQKEMSADLLTALPLWLVVAIPFAKVAATSLSIGSGGSGGVFGPGMVIGGATGAAVWRLAQDIPGVPSSPTPYVVVGMIACFGAIAHAPLGVMLMVGEMTANLSLLAPAMIAVAVAGRVVGDSSIYSSQIKDRRTARAMRTAAPQPAAPSDALALPHQG